MTSAFDNLSGPGKPLKPEPPDAVEFADALRRLRNASDYSGNPITVSAIEECIAQAKSLRQRLHAHLKARSPDLLLGWATTSAKRRSNRPAQGG
ncbi:MAG: hypothetical protein R3E41_02995 [Burkholderiaceae bacterium]